MLKALNSKFEMLKECSERFDFEHSDLEFAPRQARGKAEPCRSLVSEFEFRIFSQDGNSRRDCMLVLSRMVDETIMIGDNIEIMVVDVKGGRVKLGIRAPQSVPVYRKEIYMAIKNENLASSESIPTEHELKDIAKFFGR